MLTPGELFEFIDELRDGGFNVGAEQYIAAQDLLLALAAQGRWSGHAEELRTYLAPLLCKSPREQENFNQYFEQWLERKPHLAAPSVAKKEPVVTESTVPPSQSFLQIIREHWQDFVWFSRRWWKVAAVLSVLIVIGGMIYFSRQTPQQTQPAQPNTDTTSTTQSSTDTTSAPPSPAAQPIQSNQQQEEMRLRALVAKINAFADAEQYRGWPGFYRRYYAVIRFGVAILPLLFFLGWFYRQRPLLEKGSAAKTPELHRLKVKGAGEQLFHGPTFRRFAQEMRRHRESGVGDLDLPATVETTTQQGGIFTPVYGKRQILPEYLVLIDRASFHDQQARFVDENLARLRADGVFVERYYFDCDPRVCRSDDPYSPHLTLQELAARYSEHRLMIFSDGAGLMHPLTGRPQRWLELFSAWTDRAVLTLEAPRHWGYREMALSGLDFVVLPATQAGLAVLIETFQTKQALTGVPQNGSPLFPEMLRRRPLLYLERLAPEPAAIEQLCAQLHAFLGDDGYDWLAACAVYPTLAWDITLYLGHQLTDANGQKLLTEERLLALARLTWFRHGSMPDWLRLRLIRSLAPEQEHAVRDALEGLLKSADEQPRDGFPLDIARPPKDWELRAWKKRLRDLLLTAPEDSSLQDYVFLTFMSGRKPRKLAVSVPNFLQRLLYHQGQVLLGLRPVTALLIAFFFAFAGWTLVGQNKPVVPRQNFIPHFKVEVNIVGPKIRKVIVPTLSRYGAKAANFPRHNDFKPLNSVTYYASLISSFNSFNYLRSQQSTDTTVKKPITEEGLTKIIRNFKNRIEALFRIYLKPDTLFYARSDSAWSYYSESFYIHQNESSRNSFVKTYLSGDDTMSQVLSFDNSVESTQLRAALYMSWLKDNFTSVLPVGLDSLIFYVEDLSDSTQVGIMQWKSQPLYLKLNPMTKSTPVDTTTLTSQPPPLPDSSRIDSLQTLEDSMKRYLRLMEEARSRGQYGEYRGLAGKMERKIKQMKDFIDKSFRMYLQKREIREKALDRGGAKG